MRSPLGHRIPLALAAVALLAGFAPGATAGAPSSQGGAASDRSGDVQITTSEPPAPADLDRVDLTGTSWRVTPGRRAAFRLRLADVADGPLRTYYAVKARTAGVSVFVKATGRRVVIDDGIGVRRCPGSRSVIDRERDRVRISLPVRCLPAASYTFVPVAYLHSADGGDDLAFDRAARTERVTLR